MIYGFFEISNFFMQMTDLIQTQCGYKFIQLTQVNRFPNLKG